MKTLRAPAKRTCIHCHREVYYGRAGWVHYDGLEYCFLRDTNGTLLDVAHDQIAAVN